jgi:hypothetical protein
VDAVAGLAVGSLRTDGGTSGGRQLRDERLDRSAAAATSPGEYGFVVLRREASDAASGRRERQRAGGQQVEDHGKAPAARARVDAIAGGVLGEAEGFRAIAEEGAQAQRGIQRRPRVEHGQVGDEIGGALALLPASAAMRARRS